MKPAIQSTIYLRSWDTGNLDRAIQFSVSGEFKTSDFSNVKERGYQGFYTIRNQHFYALYADQNNLWLQINSKRISFLYEAIKIIGPLTFINPTFSTVCIFSNWKLFHCTRYVDPYFEAVDQGMSVGAIDRDEYDWWNWLKYVTCSQELCQGWIDKWTVDNS